MTFRALPRFLEVIDIGRCVRARFHAFPRLPRLLEVFDYIQFTDPSALVLPPPLYPLYATLPFKEGARALKRALLPTFDSRLEPMIWRRGAARAAETAAAQFRLDGRQPQIHYPAFDLKDFNDALRASRA